MENPMTPSTNPMESNTYTVEIRDIYGKPTVYPICDTAKTFAALIGTKTLTDQALMHINSLGYTMKIKQRELT
jgi:hypothetical protein